MRCFYRFVVAGGGVLGGTEFTGNWADSVNERSAVGSGTETESQGWDFDESTQEQMVCSFVVPPDYSFSSETEPSVYLIGWPIEADICALDPFTRTVDFGVSSRAYVNGDLANEAWSSEDTMTLSYPCEDLACSGGIDCNEPFRVKAGVADATNDAGNWSTGDLVFVRIRRMVATDDFNGDFHVAQVLLRYDAGY